MSKSIYLLIFLILGVNFWELSLVDSILNSKTVPFIALLWAILGLYLYRNKFGVTKSKKFKKYNKYFYWLMTGFFLSIFPAYFFRDQDFITSLIVNRGLIIYIFLPIILYIQPSEKEIIRTLVYYTIVYMIIWIIQALYHQPISTALESKLELGRARFELQETEFGYLFPGFTIILVLLYYKIQQFKENVSIVKFIPVAVLISLFFIFQNRGTLFFAILVFGFAIFKIRSKYKTILFFFFGSLILLAIVSTSFYWSELFKQTTEDLSNPDYNRIKSFFYFGFVYSPHWLCDIFGNGFLSLKTSGGFFIDQLKNEGLFQSDMGLMGLWSLYGVIPLIIIFNVISKILLNKRYPFYIKAMAAHIILIPISWAFNSEDIPLLIILIYLFALYTEINSDRVTSEN